MIAAIELSPVGLAAAFAAGVVSFLSPCVWPLLPAYLSYVSGVGYADLSRSSRRVVVATAAFVLGFGSIFTLFGAGIGLLGAGLSQHREAIQLVGGVLVVVMGLALMGMAGGVFGRELRVQLTQRPVTLVGAVLVGMVFAVGWSPCIGPTLGSILLLAGSTGGAGQGAALLAAYSLGLGIPFLAAGLFLSSTMAALGVFRRHGAAVNRVAGLTLVLAGILLATGRLTEITQRLSSFGSFV